MCTGRSKAETLWTFNKHASKQQLKNTSKQIVMKLIAEMREPLHVMLENEVNSVAGDLDEATAELQWHQRQSHGHLQEYQSFSTQWDKPQSR